METAELGDDVVDLTSAMGALTIAGPLARELFARFTAIDLRPQVTRCTASARLGGAHAGAILREAEDRWLMLFGAALGSYVWTVVADAAASLGGGPVGIDALAEVTSVLDIFRRRPHVAPALRAQGLLRRRDRRRRLARPREPPTTSRATTGSPTSRCSRRATSARAAGRNTTILRSNYKTVEGARFYDASRSSTRGSAPSSTSTCCSRRTATTLAHSDRAMFVMANRAEVNRINGIDSRLIYPTRSRSWRRRCRSTTRTPSIRSRARSTTRPAA